MGKLIGELVWLHDGPFGDSSAIPTYIVSKLTREHVTVALTGDGGDELFCGYARLIAAEAAEHLPSSALRVAQWIGQHLPGANSERSLLARANRFLSVAALPLADRVARWNSMFLSDIGSLLRRDLQEQVDMEDPLTWQRTIFAGLVGASPLSQVLQHNFVTYLPYDLLVKVDRAAMAHALETRAPFLATDLLEYAAGLPNSYRRRGLLTKRILREAFADLLPPQIRSRGKMGFGMPLGTWFRGALRDYLLDHLGPSARIHEYLERRTVSGYLSQHMAGQADHSHRLWTLLTLELWLRALPQWGNP
jgi:asparagine synthase (glutamine-hydrolysing)